MVFFAGFFEESWDLSFQVQTGDPKEALLLYGVQSLILRGVDLTWPQKKQLR